MTNSVMLVIITALVTGLILHLVRFVPKPYKPMSHEEKEAGRAKDIGTLLDGARDRASVVEVERNKLALAKTVKAALWVTEARLNVAVPELLKTAQLWMGQSERGGKKWQAPAGVSQIEGLDDAESPWAAWYYNDQHWRIEAQWLPVIKDIVDDVGTCKVLLDQEVVLDMTIGRKDQQVMWIDALTVGPWVSDLLIFAGVQATDAQERSSAKSARQTQERADKIRWL